MTDNEDYGFRVFDKHKVEKTVTEFSEQLGIQEPLNEAKSFYQEHRELINVTLFMIVVFKIEKRMFRKELNKALGAMVFKFVPGEVPELDRLISE